MESVFQGEGDDEAINSAGDKLSSGKLIAVAKVIELDLPAIPVKLSSLHTSHTSCGNYELNPTIFVTFQYAWMVLCAT